MKRHYWILGLCILCSLVMMQGCTSSSSSGGATGTTTTITPSVELPDAPSNFAITTASGNQLRLSWTAPSSNSLAGYYVYRSTSTPPIFTRQQSSVLTDTHFFTTAPAVSSSFHYYVVAVNTSQQEGASTNVITYTTPDETPPATPAGLTFTRSGDDAVIEWDPNTESDLAGYNIYRQTEGSSTFVKQNSSLISTTLTQFSDSTNQFDVTYNYRVTAVDTSNNESPSSSSLAIKMDGTSPVVTLSSKPALVTSSNAATFVFSANEPTTFTCRLDSQSAASCSSPHVITGLSDGSHTLVITATDSQGNSGSTSASWSLDATTPVITLSSQPAPDVNTNNATFVFTVSEESVRVDAVVDGTTFVNISSPYTVTGLSEGNHSVTLRASDAVNNSSSQTISWTIDLTAPTITIVSQPASTVSSLEASISFSTSGSDIHSTTYTLNGVSQGSATTPLSLSNLPEGSNNVVITVADAVGNTSSATVSWTVRTLVSTIGSFGFSDGQFRLPEEIDEDSSGNLYVSESGGNQRVQAFSSSGTFIRGYSIAANPDSEVGIFPAHGVALSSGDKLYIADTRRNAIRIYDSPSDPTPFMWTAPSFSGPEEVFVDSNGNIYVADTGHHRVLVFNADRQLQLSLGTSGQAGSANNQFNSPQDVTTDSNGNIYVVDTNNHRVQLFNAAGNFVATLGSGSVGSDHGSFNNPSAIAIHPDGSIYVVDASNHRVEIFSSSRSYLRSIGTGSSGATDSTFNFPRGIMINSSNKVFVVDQGNSRVQVFQR